MTFTIGQRLVVGPDHGSIFSEGEVVLFHSSSGGTHTGRDVSYVNRLNSADNRQAVFTDSLRPEGDTSEESLDSYKERVRTTFLDAARRTGVSGVPDLLRTLGIDPDGPAATAEPQTFTVDVETARALAALGRCVGGRPSGARGLVADFTRTVQEAFDLDAVAEQERLNLTGSVFFQD